MTDLATAGETNPARFTHRVGREVVVQHEGVTTLTLQGINNLSIPAGAKSHGTNGLGFTPGKQRRAMGLFKNIDLTHDRSHGSAVSSVDTRLTADDALADDIFLQGLELILDLIGRGSTLDSNGSDGCVTNLTHAFVAGRFFRNAIGFAQGRLGLGFYCRLQGLVHGRSLPLPAGFARLLNQFINCLDDGLHLLVGKQYSAQHLIFCQFLGF